MQELARHRDPQNLYLSGFDFLIAEITWKSKYATLTRPTKYVGCICMFAAGFSSK